LSLYPVATKSRRINVAFKEWKKTYGINHGGPSAKNDPNAKEVLGTGRLTPTDPNLQNIPVRTEEGRVIRRAFIAKD
jgi:predicted pyridoxine 5'-phosphate oxidase superfamily flavin-nucleotide-binding protein